MKQFAYESLIIACELSWFRSVCCGLFLFFRRQVGLSRLKKEVRSPTCYRVVNQKWGRRAPIYPCPGYTEPVSQRRRTAGYDNKRLDCKLLDATPSWASGLQGLSFNVPISNPAASVPSSVLGSEQGVRIVAELVELFGRTLARFKPVATL